MPTSVPHFNFLAPLGTDIWRGSQNKNLALLIFPDAPVSLPSPIDLTRRPYNTGHTTVWPCDNRTTVLVRYIIGCIKITDDKSDLLTVWLCDSASWQENRCRRLPGGWHSCNVPWHCSAYSATPTWWMHVYTTHTLNYQLPMTTIISYNNAADVTSNKKRSCR